MCDVGVIETNGSLTEPDKIDETVDNFLWRVEGGESMAITPPQQHASAAYILQNYIIYATECKLHAEPHRARLLLLRKCKPHIKQEMPFVSHKAPPQWLTAVAASSLQFQYADKGWQRIDDTENSASVPLGAWTKKTYQNASFKPSFKNLNILIRCSNFRTDEKMPTFLPSILILFLLLLNSLTFWYHCHQQRSSIDFLFNYERESSRGTFFRALTVKVRNMDVNGCPAECFTSTLDFSVPLHPVNYKCLCTAV